MHNSDQENQDQRKTTAMDDSTVTIEYLRVRLLSERSVSKTARQRADELAKRVAELEEQLKIVSHQRKKAERATEEVLAILENHGMGDVSETFDSSSDQEVTPRESKVSNNSMKEEDSSVNSKVSRNDTEEMSGSELECSPPPGGSLSWKGSKNSSHSLEKKHRDSSTRRRSSFASSGSSSPKHWLGKSCRQIRRREMRSTVGELKVDGVMLDSQSNGVPSHSEGLCNCSESGPGILGEGSEIHEEKNLLKGMVSGCMENQREMTNAGQYLNGHGRDKDMERALEHQAQLIGQYEAEEKAQREWEEKFRENNGSTPDSCEPGNQSDVTDEREEMKAQGAFPAGTIASQYQEAKSEVEDVGFAKESSRACPNGFQPPSHVDTGRVQDKKYSSTIAYESPTPEFAFPMAKGEKNQEILENYSHHPLSHGSHHRPGPHDFPENQPAPIISAPHSASNFEKGETSGSRNKSGELMLQEAPGGLDGVLDALQQAKLSLQHKLNRFPLLEGGSVGQAVEPSVHVMRASDKVEIPVGWDGLFKVPTDFKFEPTTQAKFLSSGSRSSLPNYYPDMGIAVTAGDRFLPSPYLETRSSISSSDRFFPSPYMERRLGGSSSDRFLTSPYALGVSSNDRFLTISPYVEMGSRVSTQKPYSDPYLDTGLPSSSRFIHTTYPSFGEQMPRMPTDEGFSRSVPSRAGGIPPADNFSFYNDQVRPNMYR